MLTLLSAVHDLIMKLGKSSSSGATCPLFTLQNKMVARNIPLSYGWSVPSKKHDKLFKGRNENTRQKLT